MIYFPVTGIEKKPNTHIKRFLDFSSTLLLCSNNCIESIISFFIM